MIKILCLFHLIHLLQCNPGSKNGEQIVFTGNFGYTHVILHMKNNNSVKPLQIKFIFVNMNFDPKKKPEQVPAF